jgi:hypothetical protein
VLLEVADHVCLPLQQLVQVLPIPGWSTHTGGWAE